MSVLTLHSQAIPRTDPVKMRNESERTFAGSDKTINDSRTIAPEATAANGSFETVCAMYRFIGISPPMTVAII